RTAEERLHTAAARHGLVLGLRLCQLAARGGELLLELLHLRDELVHGGDIDHGKLRVRGRRDQRQQQRHRKSKTGVSRAHDDSLYMEWGRGSPLLAGTHKDWQPALGIAAVLREEPLQARDVVRLIGLSRSVWMSSTSSSP